MTGALTSGDRDEWDSLRVGDVLRFDGLVRVWDGFTFERRGGVFTGIVMFRSEGRSICLDVDVSGMDGRVTTVMEARLEDAAEWWLLGRNEADPDQDAWWNRNPAPVEVFATEGIGCRG